MSTASERGLVCFIQTTAVALLLPALLEPLLDTDFCFTLSGNPELAGLPIILVLIFGFASLVLFWNISKRVDERMSETG